MKFSSMAAIFAAMTLSVNLGACHGAFLQPGDSAAQIAKPSPPTGGEGAGKAHLYVYLGRVHGQLFSHANGRESDFYINGIDVGTVSGTDYLYIDLEPGVYDFSWQRHHDFPGTVQSAHDYDMVQPDQELFLALNVDRNVGALIAPIGWWIDPDTGHIADTFPRGRLAVADRQVLRPTPAILARLHPIAGPATYLPASW
jgi:hypothetical protein